MGSRSRGEDVYAKRRRRRRERGGGQWEDGDTALPVDAGGSIRGERSTEGREGGREKEGCGLGRYVRGTKGM